MKLFGRREPPGVRHFEVRLVGTQAWESRSPGGLLASVQFLLNVVV